ncbi:unnamed protein product [marine sediment metagenome]|uniref:Glyoxalase I n=1 Tax=marine sediment metagenome TaxID=412755 RepID=X1AF10_9ZZZZ
MRIIYTNLRVANLEKSVEFYTKILGMQMHRQVENKEFCYSLVWLGFSDIGNDATAGIELIYNWDQSSYDLGSGFGQIVIGTEDVYKTCEDIKAKGWTFTREAGPVKGGQSIIAFLEDPDGYRIEFVEMPKQNQIF